MERYYITKEYSNRLTGFFVGPGDIIVSCAGTIGEIYELPSDAEQGVINQALMRVRVHNDVNKSWFKYAFSNMIAAFSAKYSNGSAIKNIPPFADLKSYKLSLPVIGEQRKVGRFLSFIDARIDTQNKIIEELFSSEETIIDAVFCQQENGVLSDFIEETSNQNRDNKSLTVFSVSNKLGFIPQSEQFEEKKVASANKRNYKVVTPSTFAYNPARINVGSIGFYSGDSPVIVSPMYVCFTTRNINPTILNLFFKSKAFFKQMSSKLEGSVRQCLTFQGMKSIKLHVPNTEDARLLTLVTTIREKRMTEEKILQNYLAQRQFFLRNMFI